MFDIRKIQENVIYQAVETESNADTAREVVYGKDSSGKSENSADVELQKSIKMGDDVCLMKITLHNPVWE